ncbi:head-tail connector protein [Alloalcanivorax sp. C16-1]|uniref:head-tail connector protein n=1 Tax=Alloalcanivorax sp. C16-1 TaxID=3390051 RepID=UPI0039704853
MISLQAAKVQCRIEQDETAEDSYLEDIVIPGAIRNAEQITQHRFQAADVSLTLDDLPAGAIELPWTPTRSVSEITYLDPDGIEQTLPAEAYRLDARGVLPRLRPIGAWPATDRTPQNVTITAAVGYEEIPPDAKIGILLLVGHLYENREATIAGVSIAELPLGVMDFLSPYMLRPVG